MIRYASTKLSRTQTEFLAEYRAVVDRFGHLPTEHELAAETHLSVSGVHRHLVNIRELTGEELPTRGFDYWRTLHADNHALAQRVTVAEGTLELVRDWLESTDELYGVGAGVDRDEWSSSIEGRAELVWILEASHG